MKSDLELLHERNEASVGGLCQWPYGLKFKKKKKSLVKKERSHKTNNCKIEGLEIINHHGSKQAFEVVQIYIYIYIYIQRERERVTVVSDKGLVFL